MLLNDTRFAEKLEAYADRSGGPDACWEWTKSVSRGGYGRLHVPGEKSRWVQAHRVSWSLANGREPAPGMFICHRCDNPKCVNPAHLFEGTPRDNMRDMWNKERMHKVRPYVAGDKSGQSKLTSEIVVSCRRRAKAGESLRGMADEYGVNRTTIEQAVRGDTWYVLNDIEPPCHVSRVIGNSAITSRWRARQRGEV